mmetsp:Transcript_33841/g.84940  ORF Transcript_33841/g.84940 Transcript_33841/m.84940 type:complete len:299 (-) Transcript_33841:395-1291(-)
MQRSSFQCLKRASMLLSSSVLRRRTSSTLPKICETSSSVQGAFSATADEGRLITSTSLLSESTYDSSVVNTSAAMLLRSPLKVRRNLHRPCLRVLMSSSCSSGSCCMSRARLLRLPRRSLGRCSPVLVLLRWRKSIARGLNDLRLTCFSSRDCCGEFLAPAAAALSTDLPSPGGAPLLPRITDSMLLARSSRLGATPTALRFTGSICSALCVRGMASEKRRTSAVVESDEGDRSIAEPPLELSGLSEHSADRFARRRRFCRLLAAEDALICEPMREPDGDVSGEVLVDDDGETAEEDV